MARIGNLLLLLVLASFLAEFVLAGKLPKITMEAQPKRQKTTCSAPEIRKYITRHIKSFLNNESPRKQASSAWIRLG